MSRSIFVGAAAVLLLAGANVRAALTYNFDTPGTEASNGGHGDGADAQGWTDTLGTSRATFTIPGGRASVVPNDPNTGAPNQDLQNPKMVFSSPAFTLPNAGSHTLTVDLAGGQGNGADPVAAGNLPANLGSLGSNGDLAGGSATDVLILGLRKVSDDTYVSFLQKNQLADAWSGYSWDLSPFADGTTAYKVDQIDTRFGGWGHIEMDNVVIPGTAVPEPACLGLVGISALLVGRRRR